MTEGLGDSGFEGLVEAAQGAAVGVSDLGGRVQLAQATTQAEPRPADQPVSPPTQVSPPPVAPPPAVHFDAATSKVVRLPQGTSLENIEIAGKDIVLKQADGRSIVIDNGVSNVPTLMVGDVEVPVETLAAVFSSQGIVAAAGPSGAQASNVGSSGGNFSVPNGNVGSFFGLTDLLPPTDLQFPTLEQREIGSVRRLSVGPSALSSTASVTLSEAALSSGSDSARPDEIGRAALSFNTGSLPVSGVHFAPDLGSLQTEINGLPGADIVWVRLSDTAIVGRVGGVDTVLLQIEPVSGQATGTAEIVITATLLGPLPHAPGGGLQTVDLGSINVVVQTGAGTAQGSVQIAVTDDGPSIAAVAGNAPALTVDETTLGSDATASFAGAFTPSFGADGQGTVTYALGVNAGASGLVDTATGQAVVLVMNGTTVEGRAGAGGPVVFTVTVAANGDVTLDQQRAVVHPTANPNEPATLSAASLVTLTATITDKDGDSNAATLDIGGNLSFLDDGPSIAAVAGNAPALTVDETTLGSDATASFAGAFTPSFGADGQGTVTYALGVNAGASGLVDTATGQAVVLVMNGTTVEGRAGAGGPVVFTVTVAANGDVTLDQQRAVVHPTANPNEPATLSVASLVTLTATITDKDGDSNAATLDIGGNLSFLDDGPSIAAVAGNAPALTVDETTLGSDATASFAGAFTPSFGADGQGTVTYALGVNAGASGLVDTATGQAVVLVMNGTTVEGRAGAGGPVVFTVTVAANGDVTLDQQRAVVHPTANPNEPATLSAASLVTLTATITDKDGDSNAATLDIGGNLSFLDDGPSIAAVAGNAPALTVDETTLGSDATASFAGAFTPGFGADGQGTVTYALGVNAGASGLVDTATGQAVVLVMNGTTVEGRAGAGGPVVFTVTVAANGDVTLDQQRAVVHPTANPNEPATLSVASLVTLTATITDKDGDSNAATLDIGGNLSFLDDGPSIAAVAGNAPALTVDETTLGSDATASFAGAFTPSFGADGQGTVTYALGVNAGASGLVDTATGQAVVLVMNGTTVEGRAGAGGPVVFTVTVAANGDVTLDQQRAVVHPTANPNEPATLSAASLVTLTATITDKDGDSNAATLDIGGNLSFLDDGPSIAAVAGNAPALTVDETTLGSDATASFAGAFTPSFGADGQGTVTYALGVNAGASGLVDTATGQAVVLVMNGTTVEGRAGAGGPVVFTVTVAANGDVTLDQQRAVVHPTANPNEPATLSAASLVTLTATITDKDGDSNAATLDIGGNLSFLDDGPSIAAVAGNAPALTVDETTLGSDATASFAGAFTPGFGADGQGTVTYALGVNAGASGLVDTATGQAVVLVMNGTTVEGRAGAGGPVVFTVTVAANGDVTLDQQRAVVHPTANPNEPATLSAASLVTLTATITDKDGDSNAATLDIGGNLSFLDDGPSIAAVAGNAPALTVDETTLGSDATASFAGAFTPGFGADGQGTVTYALGVNAGASGLVDTATGQAVVLVMNGTTVEGRAGAGGPVVFTVTVAANGDVTLDQQRAVVHPTANPNEPATLSAASLVTLTATITDKDGDSNAATLDIGGNLSFLDDGPSIAAVAGNAPALTVDETTLGSDATASFAGAFTPGFGADGQGTVTYALGVNAGASGLVDTATGQAVVLVMNGTTVEGRAGAGGPVVFTVTVAANGDVTLDQQRAVVHPTANPNEPATLSAASLVTLTATITDKDGDSNAATLDIGGNLSFLDDGPSIAAVAGNAPALTVDETTLGSDATASFAGAFTPGFGADGQGTVTYALGVNAGASGLVDTATGQAVVLVMNGTTVEGRAGAGGPVVFTVTVAANGDVTLDQQRAVVHPTANPNEPATLSAASLVTLTATITDKDGDSNAATLDIGGNLSFLDDGPSIAAVAGNAPALTVDETTLGSDATASFAGAFTPSFGADGQGTVTYALGVNAGASGLVDTATGQAVVLVMNGTTVEGRAGAGGPVVFTVTVAANGDVTLDQQRAVVHPTANPNEPATLSAASLVTLTATITDKDGDSNAATLDIGGNLSFLDDGPSIAAVAGNAPALTVDETTLGSDATASFAGAFTPSFGADGQGTVTYALGVNAGASGLVDTATGQAVVLVMNGTTVEGRAGAGGPVVFTVTVAANGDVTLDQQRAVVHPTANPNEPATLSAASLVTLTATITDKDGDSNAATLDIGGNLSFLDDGPSIAAVAGNAPALTVDETTLGSDATASFAGAFTPGFGADGQGTVTYALGVNAGASGLVDTATGQAVVLVMNGTTVEGRAGAGGPVVFTVTVAANGDVTLDQQRAVVHPTANPNEPATLSAASLVTLTATITDKDGDSNAATLDIGGNLSFLDDGPSIAAVAGNAPALTVDETTLGSDATASFAGAFTPSFGADGQGTVTYALGVNAGASGLVDTATGQAVVLVMNGTTVEGRAGAGGPVVFTVTVAANGDVTLDQQRAVVHPTANPNEPATLSAASLVTLTATITDKDGDSNAATLDIGGNLSFLDDGPSIAAVAGNAPALTVDETTLGSDATASFAGAFTPSFGADGQGTVTYALGVNAGASGLVDTATGQAVVLVMNGTTVEGRAGAGGPVVFTVTVAANGDVTLDQQRAVVHPTANPNEPATLSAASLVTLTATITDKDGDSNAATLDIGGNLSFLDDGPSIAAVAGNAPALTVDETTLGSDATASFAGAFTPSFGADGQGTVTYALGVNAGASGLVDTATGQAVVLVMNGTTVEGRAGAGGPVVFTVTVAANGDVTLDQQRAVVHPTANPNEPATLSVASLVTLTATITDKDGDSNAATLDIGGNLSFLDDGPSIAAVAGNAPALTVDETTLGSDATASFAGAFTPSFGADGQGTVTYALGVNAGASGLVDTATGQAVVLVMNGTTVEGRAGAGGPVVFTVTVAANGDVTLDQQRAVVHPTANPNEPATLSAASLVTLTATITDKDGDSNAATLDIGGNLSFLDDGPSAPTPTYALLQNGINHSGTFDLDQDHTLANNYGTDGGTVTFAVAEGADSGLKSSGAAIYYHLSNGGHTLIGYTNSDGTLSYSAGDTAVFTITLDPATAHYSVAMNGTVDSLTSVNFSGNGYAFVGGNKAWTGFVPTGDSVSGPKDNNSSDLLLTGIGGTVNTSANSGGIGDGASVGSGETFRVDFVQDLRNGVGGGYLFDQHYTTNNTTATFTATNGSKILISAYDDHDTNTNLVGETNPADRSIDTISQVIVAYGNDSWIFTSSGSHVIGGHSYTVTFNADGNGSVSVDGIYGTSGNQAVGTNVAISTASGFNSVEYQYLSGGTFKIGEFGSAVPSSAPVSFNVPIQVVDGDGDAASAALGITLTSSGIQDHSLDGSGASHIYTASAALGESIVGSDYNDTLNGDAAANVLFGGLGNDTLIGNDGNDVLIGGVGTNTLTGGAGADTFVIDPSHLTVSASDLITDYSGKGGQSDVIDLSTLLASLGANAPTTAAQVDAVVNVVAVAGGGASLQVNDHGTSAGGTFVEVAHFSTTPASGSVQILYDDSNTHAKLTTTVT
ncbi:hypothetical protein FHT98_3050 [Bosea sp. AK1]|nr:hypothetical protein FHT98_3050 [Bosea sp. AK1]